MWPFWRVIALAGFSFPDRGYFEPSNPIVTAKVPEGHLASTVAKTKRGDTASLAERPSPLGRNSLTPLMRRLKPSD